MAAVFHARRRDDIQGMRALAMLMIFGYHTDLPVPGGFTGPDVFFVISGFVITAMLLREHAATGAISISQFYVRRARRLLPALALTSVATLAAATLLLSPIGDRQPTTGSAVASAAAFSANVYFFHTTGNYFQPVAKLNPYLHTWTLSLEEQFYFAFPIAMVLIWGAGRRESAGRLLAVLLAGFGLSLAACLILSYGWLPMRWPFTWFHLDSRGLRMAFFLPFTRAWGFLAGAILALVALRWVPSARTRIVSGWVGLALVAVTLFAIRSTDNYPGFAALLPVGAALGLLIGGLGGDTSTSRLLSIRPMVWLGDRSYGWYLWHWPAIVFARVLFPATPFVAVTAAIASLVPAALSYRFVEEPIRRGQRWPSRRATAALALASVGLPLVAGVGLTAAANRGWGSERLATLQRIVAPNHIDLLNGCASMLPLGHAERARCVWPTDNARGTMLLIGDSNAGHLSEPFIAAAHALGYDAQIATAGSCPLLLRPGPYLTEECRDFVEGGMATILERTPAYAAVVSANAAVGYLGGTRAPLFAADVPEGRSEPGASSRAMAIRGWIADLRRTLEAMTPRSPVILVGAVPQFPNMPQCLRPSLLSGPAEGCGIWSARMAATARADIIAAERALAAEFGVGYVDTGDRLCSPDGCHALVEGLLMYRDGGHLSVEGSMRFEPDLQRALSAAIAVSRSAQTSPPAR